MSTLLRTLAIALAVCAPARADVAAPDGDAAVERATACPRPPATGRTVGELEAELESSRRPMPAADLYDLGVLLLGEGRIADARARMLLLIKEQPSAPEVEDVYLRFGDLFERQGDPELALQLFARIAAQPGARCSDVARYRLGRLSLALGREARARTALAQVAAAARSPALRAAARRLLDGGRPGFAR